MPPLHPTGRFPGKDFPFFHQQVSQAPVAAAPPSALQGGQAGGQGGRPDRRKRPWQWQKKNQEGFKKFRRNSNAAAMAKGNRQRTKQQYPQGTLRLLGLSSRQTPRRFRGPGTKWRGFRAGQQATPQETPRTVPRAPFLSTTDLIKESEKSKYSTQSHAHLVACSRCSIVGKI